MVSRERPTLVRNDVLNGSHSAETNHGSRWHGRMSLDIGWGWFQGSIGKNDRHAHHALQIAFADRPISFFTPGSGWTRHNGFIVACNQVHQLAADTSSVVLVYVEPDSHAGRIIGRRLGAQPVVALESAERDRLSAVTLCNGTQAFNKCIEHSLAIPDQPVQLLPLRDDLISHVIQTVQRSIDGSFQARELAHQAGLSLSRFQHRFRRHTGMAVRPFLRWRRLLQAITHLQDGRSISDAAYAAGFSDAAHMSRTMRRHFGISPRDIAALLSE